MVNAFPRLEQPQPFLGSEVWSVQEQQCLDLTSIIPFRLNLYFACPNPAFYGIIFFIVCRQFLCDGTVVVVMWGLAWNPAPPHPKAHAYYSSLLFCCCDKHSDQKQLRGGQGLFHLVLLGQGLPLSECGGGTEVKTWEFLSLRSQSLSA